MAQRSLLASIPMASLLLMVSASVAGASGGLAVSEPQVQPDPAITIDSAWGLAVDRRPTVSSHVPAPKDRGNSSGGTNTIIRNRVGGYTVRMAGLGAPGGVPSSRRSAHRGPSAVSMRGGGTAAS